MDLGNTISSTLVSVDCLEKWAGQPLEILEPPTQLQAQAIPPSPLILHKHKHSPAKSPPYLLVYMGSFFRVITVLKQVYSLRVTCDYAGFFTETPPKIFPQIQVTPNFICHKQRYPYSSRETRSGPLGMCGSLTVVVVVHPLWLPWKWGRTQGHCRQF